MEISGIVTFTTDFGTSDPYAGIMKGIVMSANPNARIVDLTHQISPHDIVNGAFVLMRSYKYFPEGTVHVAVVDPGVGGSRKNIAVRTGGYYFVGPDNGLLGLVLDMEKNYEIREITNPPFVLDKISDTFHGRDVFSPCAGQLSGGAAFEDVGKELKRFKHLDYPKVQREGDVLRGEIVSVDSFGNLITNINEHTFSSFAGKRVIEIFFGSERFSKIHQRYGDVDFGRPLALIGSCGFLEISRNEGSAASYFMTSVGSPVTIRKI